jgi:DNA polymerase III delta subunit
MHSKWQIWDFFASYKRDTLNDYEGALALNTFDPICLKLVKDYLTRGLGEKILHYKMASEVTKAWFEEEFQTLSLFGNSESFFIHQAHDLPAEILELLSKTEITGRFLILSFENELTAWKKLVKDGKTSTLVIEPPRFWELNKLLDFVGSYLRLPLSYEAKSWMLDALENNLGTFYNACCLLKLNHPDAKEVALKDVKELLTLERLDQFQMASLVARKKHKEFFEKMVALEGDFEKMRGFFNFMQGHFVKMADTSYLSQKPRLTQYDKDLQSTAKLWKSNEMMKMIETFNRWELLCKRKDNQLWHELKEAHLRSL